MQANRLEKVHDHPTGVRTSFEAPRHRGASLLALASALLLLLALDGRRRLRHVRTKLRVRFVLGVVGEARLARATAAADNGQRTYRYTFSK